MMDITSFALQKKRISISFLAIVLVGGIAAYRAMPRAEDPGFIVRTALIQTVFPGASPERVELLVTDKLEEAIQEMPELDFVSSKSQTGISIIYVNIKESYADLRPIWDQLRRKVDQVRPELPSGVRGPYVNDEFGDVFGTIIALTGEGFTYEELKDVADACRNAFLLDPNIAKVVIEGEQDERVFVEFKGARLAELGLSPGQLSSALESRNIIFPGGVIYTSDEQIAMEPTGNFNSVEELRQTIIKLPGREELVFLEDLAHIYRGYEDPAKSKAFYNGQPALILGISLRDGGNIIDLGQSVREKLRQFKARYPIGVQFELLYFQPDFVDLKISDFVGNLLQAVAIVMVVMLLFLGLRTGFVVASLIPMAMCMALLVMGFLNIGIDQMSLASLIIALGMLVDNAIVMSESILVQAEAGTPLTKAAVDSAKELRVSLLTSSLTTAAAFLPIYLAESTTGEYTAPLFKVVTITLLCSWFLSLTMTPLFCVLFIRVKKTAEADFSSWYYRWYRKLLLMGVRHPWWSVLGTAVVFVASLQLFPYVPKIFFPPNDKPVMSVALTYPLGTPLTKTEAMVAKLNAFIAQSLAPESDDDGKIRKEGISQWAVFVGNGAPKFQLSYNPEPPSTNYAYLLAETSSRDAIETVLAPAISAFCRENFPDLTADAGPLALGSPVDAPVQVRVSGNDPDRIFALVEGVKRRLSQLPGTRNVEDDWGLRTKKLVVNIDQARARRAGLTSKDVAISLQTILSGIESTHYREGDSAIPVVLRAEEADRDDIGKLESHQIYVQATGRAVPLKQVADVEVVFEPSVIRRRNRIKTVTVNSDVGPGGNALELARAMEDWLREEKLSWPPGYFYRHGGELENSGKAQASIQAKLGVAGLIILFLLVAQFDSFRRPLIILLTIPLGLIGVVIGLFITRQPFGFMALLGLISLAGIVINNAIVLIDRIKIEIEAFGRAPDQAIIEACLRRMRPILLTTLTTVGGLVPLWLGGGPLFEAMAVAILFGLVFATGLTLGVVPVLYTLFFRVSFPKEE